jgi:hypothetical protein
MSKLAVTVTPLSDPEIVACESAVTGVVFSAKVAVVFPDGTVTVAGTFAAPRLLDRAILMPDGGAVPDSTTVPVDVNPPMTEFGARLIASRIGGSIVRLALELTPPIVAVSAATVFTATPCVFTWNVVVELPAGITIEPGTIAAAELLETRTDVPPLSAFPSSVTVPVALAPPLISAGLIVSVARVRGTMCRIAVWVTPAYDPEISAEAGLVTCLTEIGKDPDVIPAKIFTEAGTAAFLLSLDRDTVMPDGPAAPFSCAIAAD